MVYTAMQVLCSTSVSPTLNKEEPCQSILGLKTKTRFVIYQLKELRISTAPTITLINIVWFNVIVASFILRFAF